MSIGTRLREAIEMREWSIRKFQRVMQAEHGDRVQGTSYPAIHRYLADETAPSLEFLKVAADLLQVSAGWLITGEGVPYRTHEIQALGDRMLERRYPNAKYLPPQVRSLLIELSARFMIAWIVSPPEAREDAGPETKGRAGGYREDWNNFFDATWNLIMLPSADFYGIGHVSDHRIRQNYAAAVLAALLQIFPAHTHPMPGLEDGDILLDAQEEDVEGNVTESSGAQDADAET
jgi:transcriptional regulator with XRE-family HTH domain